MNTILGHECGYLIRFDNTTSDRTRIVYMTDSMLFDEFLHDPLLEKYSVIIIDEAHERSVYSELVLGLLKK